jgi:DNA-binding response OmpR family regulator
MKILIVDDDKLMLETISHNLKTIGYETMLAQNGFEALAIILKEKIDLIISDIMMPNISGLELVNLLKQFYYNNIPIILISSLDQREVILCSLGLNISDFISKPIDFKELHVMVKKYTKKSSLKFFIVNPKTGT